ncbi:MAG: hypothetical protein R3F14_16045 [Polyangiaceae bacterium]
MSATRATKPSGADPREASAGAAAEITPSPAPASTERSAAGPASGRFDRHEELARPENSEASSPELRDNPFVEYILSLSPEEEARGSWRWMPTERRSRSTGTTRRAS